MSAGGSAEAPGKMWIPSSWLLLIIQLGGLLSLYQLALTNSLLFPSSSLTNRKIMDAARPSSDNKHILVTGGTGYIGVHTIVCLVQAGYHITVVDNLVNSSPEGLERAKELTGCPDSQIRFCKVDLCDKPALEEIFSSSPKFQCCIHFAGLKAVGESVMKPLLYYENNLGGTWNLLELMDKYDCRSIVFSSSATVSAFDVDKWQPPV